MTAPQQYRCPHALIGTPARRKNVSIVNVPTGFMIEPVMVPNNRVAWLLSKDRHPTKKATPGRVGDVR